MMNKYQYCSVILNNNVITSLWCLLNNTCWLTKLWWFTTIVVKRYYSGTVLSNNLMIVFNTHASEWLWSWLRRATNGTKPRHPTNEPRFDEAMSLLALQGWRNVALQWADFSKVIRTETDRCDVEALNLELDSLWWFPRPLTIMLNTNQPRWRAIVSLHLQHK